MMRCHSFTHTQIACLININTNYLTLFASCFVTCIELKNFNLND